MEANLDHRSHDDDHPRPFGDLHYNLGTYQRLVTTVSDNARLWFNRGLLWAYFFNHEEALHCFIRATEHDPNCAMAYWGIAYALGPNYNKAWIRFDTDDVRASVPRAITALSQAQRLAQHVTPTERALIEASSTRFPKVEDVKTSTTSRTSST